MSRKHGKMEMEILPKHNLDGNQNIELWKWFTEDAAKSKK